MENSDSRTNKHVCVRAGERQLREDRGLLASGEGFSYFGQLS